MSIQKKMQKVLELSKYQGNEVFSIHFKTDKILVNGLSENSIEPDAAIIYSTYHKKKIIAGNVFGKTISESRENIVAIDKRKISNPTIFLNEGQEYLKINQDTPFIDSDQILIYWEYGPYVFLCLSFYDEINSMTVNECIFSNKISGKHFFRKLIFNFLPIEQKNEILSYFLNAQTNKETEDLSDEY